MAYQDALLDQLDPNRKKTTAGIQAAVDPATTPIAGNAMDVFNQRLKDNVVSSDPAQRARELADAQNASAPAPVAGLQAGKYRDKLGGFDMSKMTAEHAAKSPKYAFANIAQDYADTPEGLLALSQDPRFAAAGFQYQGKDKILAPDPDRGGALGTVDVGNSFSMGGGKGWQWGAEPGSSGGPMPVPTGGQSLAMPQGIPAPTDLSGLYGGDGGQAQINAGVDQYSEPSKYLEALLAALQQGGAV